MLETGKAVDAVQLGADYRRYPIDDHGKLRYQFFSYTNDTGAALADGTTIGLCWLPSGRKRILPLISWYASTALGASRVLDIGYDAYLTRPSGVADPEPADPDAFVDAVDVSSAVAQATFFSSVANFKYDMFSLREHLVYATVSGGTIPADAEIKGLLAYLYE